MRTADQNYMMNPEYKMLVDYMEKAIREHQYSPSEMREAAVLACVHYEMRNPRPHFMRIEDLANIPPEAFR